MTLNIYCYKNTIIESFATPIFDDHKPEDFKEIIARSIIYNINKDSVKTRQTYEGLDVYHIGVFDDVSGCIEKCEPVLLLKCSDLFPLIEKND